MRPASILVNNQRREFLTVASKQERGQKKAAQKRGFEFKQGGVKQSGQEPLGEPRKLDYGYYNYR
jgi:hypothetical protein